MARITFLILRGFVICNLSPGGTDPDTLRQLLKDKAKVQVSDRLHMKVYWSKNRGCVITSANASSNALGKDGLREAGVWLPSRTVDIDRLIRYASPRKLSERELRQLDMATKEQDKNPHKLPRRKAPAQDFQKWYSLPHRQPWKFALSEDWGSGTATAVKELTQSEYGHREPFSWLTCGKNELRTNDWVLTCVTAKNGALKRLDWLFTYFVVKIRPKEKRYYSREYPYHAVQVYGPSKCPTPPFHITPQFKKALRSAISLYTEERLLIAKRKHPPVGFLRMIEREYAAAATGRKRAA